MSNTLHILQDKIIVNYDYFLAQTQATDILLMVQAFMLVICIKYLLCTKHSERHKDESFQWVRSEII